MNAPPNALRRITVTLGTVASTKACTSFAPWRITPSFSWRVPGRKPGVSTSTSSGRAKALHVRTKRAAFWEAATSGTPPGGVAGPDDDPDRPSLEARERTDDVARAARLHLHQTTAVHQGRGDVADV